MISELLFESYLKTFMHAICRLQREQPVCRFKVKTLISLRANEATQTTIFSNWQQECFDIKDNLYNQFFIITSTEFWTFRTFHWYISSITNLYISSFPKNLYVAWWTISYISSIPTWIRYPIYASKLNHPLIICS